MELLLVIGRWLLVTFGLVRKPEFVARKISDHPTPEAIKPGYLYVVGGCNYVKWAYFRCPSDESEIIQLSLMTKRHPSWRVTIDMLGRPTLHPSVRQLDGSLAHFWVKTGHIEWCAGSGKL
jgi:hypothetical protein